MFNTEYFTELYNEIMAYAAFGIIAILAVVAVFLVASVWAKKSGNSIGPAALVLVTIAVFFCAIYRG